MNILYIMCDDHSYQTISAYDHRFIETPNIDRIANEGVRFTNSFVANSLSGPSRACLLTGKHSHKNGFTDNTKRFDGSQQTFPKLWLSDCSCREMASDIRSYRFRLLEYLDRTGGLL